MQQALEPFLELTGRALDLELTSIRSGWVGFASARRLGSQYVPGAALSAGVRSSVITINGHNGTLLTKY